MKKTYTKKQITEAIAYWKKQLKKIDESTKDIKELSYCANVLYSAAISNEAYQYFMLRNNELATLKSYLLPLVNAGEQKELADKFLANSGFAKFIGEIGKALFNDGHVDGDMFYFTKDAHGDKVAVVCKLKDGMYLAACNGDKFETPEFYFTFYDKTGNCANGNRDETWLDIYSLDMPRSFALKDMNTPNGYVDFSSAEVEEKLIAAGLKKYIG